MNKDFEKRMYNIIRKHFARLIKYFTNKGKISDKFFVDCNRELIQLFESLPKSKFVKQNQYILNKSEAGLYSKKTDNYYSPCFVVAGGTSLKNFDFSLLKDKITIVSNKSVFDVPNPNYFITTDYTFLNYLKKERKYNIWKNLNCIKFFVANCISESIKNINGQIIDTRYNLKYELHDFNEIIICKSAKSVGFDFKNFNSGYNSGFCSFQLAILLGFNPIYLLGMDMVSSKNQTHYHNGYGKSIQKMNENLDNYRKHFMNILQRLKIEKPELKIISCSPISSLNNIIEYKPIEEIL